MPFALTIDVEDWRQSVLDRRLPLSDRFVGQTRRILDLLDKVGVRATFFVLGLAAEKAPGLIREISACGHEIQSHGWDHRPVTQMSPEEFREDLRKSRAVLEDTIGRAVTGYRAPRFSIDRRSLWALEELAAAGFRYDSSIFPMRIRGYGIHDWPTGPHRITLPSGASLIEAPVACGRWLGRPFPIGGGGYWRLLPWPILRRQLRSLNGNVKWPRVSESQTSVRADLLRPDAFSWSGTPPLPPEPQASACAMFPPQTGVPTQTTPPFRSALISPDRSRHSDRAITRFEFSGVIYMHPYEIDPDALKAEPASISLFLRWHQALGRSGFEAKLLAFLAEFEVIRLDHLIAGALGHGPAVADVKEALRRLVAPSHEAEVDAPCHPDVT